MIALEGRMHPVGSGSPWVVGLNETDVHPRTYDDHIGVDDHKAHSHIVVRNTGGETLRSGQVRNDRQSLAGFLSGVSENVQAVMEATRKWTTMFDWLDEICVVVVLAHPLKAKAVADAKIKTEKIGE